VKVSVEKPGTPGELVHHGVKGQRWGVRRAYLNRVSRTAARNRRVGEGSGSAKDKFQTHLTTSNYRLSKSRSYKKAALDRATSAEDHVRRIENGQTTVRDVLRYTGGVRITDIVRGSTGRA
jgi:hypothetical protein